MMCQVKCQGCEEEGPFHGPLISCICASIVWDLCPECEWVNEQEWEESQCSCRLDEININCRWCFG